MHVKDYIAKADAAINNLLKAESQCLTLRGEKELHLLLENRDHIKKWKAEQDVHEAPVRAVPPPPVR